MLGENLGGKENFMILILVYASTLGWISRVSIKPPLSYRSNRPTVQKFQLVLLGLLSFELLNPLNVERASAQAPFYQGKTISIVVGTKAGDVYDLYPRLLAEYWTKHIPGNPNIIVQNMPGAASLIAANHVYNVAKPDGLTLAAIYPALYFDQLIKKPEAKYDWGKWNWLGSPVKSNHLLYMRADTPYKSIDDVRKATTAPKCGATGVASTGYYMPKLMEEVFGTKFDIVSGYVSGQDIDLAVERGELQCRAFTITAFHAREPFISWRKKNFVNVLVQTGNKRDPRLKETPTIYELMDRYQTSSAGRSLAKVILAAGDFGRPIVAPPGVPAERLKILRDSFDKTIAEGAFLAEAEKRRLEIDPTQWDEMEALAKDVMATPPDVVARMRKLLGE
jgi:tripartite-type tricarboxylate transporter receptor subunit TctC